MNVIFSTLFWTTLTWGIYQGCHFIYLKRKRSALFLPVAWTVAILALTLILLKIPYGDYFSFSRFWHLLLGPSTVALAIPLYEQRLKVRSVLKPLLISLLVGSVTGIISASIIALLFHCSHELIFSVAPKSVTTPIAMAISEKLGGVGSLTAIMVISTGILGAMIGLPFLKLLKLKDDHAIGFGMGMACHGVGTARAFQESTEMGAFSGLAIALNGFVTSILTPITLKIMGIY